MMTPREPRPSLLPHPGALRRLGFAALLIALCLMPSLAPARDFEMGGDSDYSIMAPEPGTSEYRAAAARKRGHKAASKHGRTPSQQTAKPAEMLPVQPPNVTPGQASKQTRRRIGSSGSVLPTPLPRTPNIPPVGAARSRCRTCRRTQCKAPPCCRPCRDRFRTSRTAQRPSRIAPRAARSSPASTASRMACRSAMSAAAWNRRGPSPPIRPRRRAPLAAS